MKVSVLVTTYNGAKYILEQLQSILDQTRKPDEVVITDDCSSDDTVELVSNFIDKNKLHDNWKIITNIKNVGFLQNSHQGAMSTTGDIIFWSDQDDVWLPAKIEKMAEAMENNEQILVLSCKYIIVDENLCKIGCHLPYSKKRIVCIKNLKYVFSSRAIAAQSLAVRRSIYLDLVTKYNNPYYYFDVIIATYAAGLHGYYVFNEPLTLYRQHKNNISNYIYSISSLRQNGYNREKAVIAQLKMLAVKKMVLHNIITRADLYKIDNAILITKKRWNCVKNRQTFKLFMYLFNLNKFVNKKWIVADIINTIQ